MASPIITRSAGKVSITYPSESIWKYAGQTVTYYDVPGTPYEIRSERPSGTPEPPAVYDPSSGILIRTSDAAGMSVAPEYAEKAASQLVGPGTQPTEITKPATVTIQRPGPGINPPAMIRPPIGIGTISEDYLQYRREISEDPANQLPSQRLSGAFRSFTGLRTEEEIAKQPPLTQIGLTAGEFALTLQASILEAPTTLPVSALLGAGYVATYGIGKVAGDIYTAILEKPYIYGTEAVLTVSVIAVGAYSGIKSLKARDTMFKPETSITEAPYTKSSPNLYNSEFLFKRGKEGKLYGAGLVYTEAEGSGRLASVYSYTAPKGESYVTQIRGYEIKVSKMDLKQADLIRSVAVSKRTEAGKIKVRSATERTELTRQVNLLGEPASMQTGMIKKGTVTPLTPTESLEISRVKSRRISPIGVGDVSALKGSTSIIAEFPEKGFIYTKTFAKEKTIDSNLLKAELDNILQGRVSDPFFKSIFEKGAARSRAGYKSEPPLAQNILDVQMTETAIKDALTPPTLLKEGKVKPTNIAKEMTAFEEPASVMEAPQIFPGVRRRADGYAQANRGYQVESGPDFIRYPPGTSSEISQATGYDLGQGSLFSSRSRYSLMSAQESRLNLRNMLGSMSAQESRLNLRNMLGSSAIAGTAQEPRLDLGQLSQQKSSLTQARRLAQRSRSDSIFGYPSLRETPFSPDLGQDINLTTRRGPPLPPLFLMEPSGGLEGGGSDTDLFRKRRLFYSPSIGGMLSGRTISRPPSSVLSGLEVRYPVKGGRSFL